MERMISFRWSIFQFPHNVLRAVTESFRNGSEDVLEVICHLMTGLVTRTVAFLLGIFCIIPERLRNALLHYPSNLSAGGIVLNHYGNVTKFLPLKEDETFVCKVTALILDVAAFGVITFV